jgi:AraC family transcriptional regulator, regulatory protein of adaptative response / methylated-DNA-[protein]-cysteine methyltransferase
MNLMIPEAAWRSSHAVTQADVAVESLLYAIGECALGQVLVARSGSGVCAILLGVERDELEAGLADRFPKARLVASEAAVHDDLAKLIRFVDKPASGFISRSTCAARRSSAASGRSFVPSLWGGQ